MNSNFIANSRPDRILQLSQNTNFNTLVIDSVLGDIARLQPLYLHMQKKKWA